MSNSNPNNKFEDEDIKQFVTALGALAEMSLVFYRDLLNSGATPNEAFKLTQAFIAVHIFGNTGGSKSE